MNFLNIHSRIIHQPKDKVTEMIESVASTNDKVWPSEQWPRIRFKEGKHVGAHGKHGPIAYTINKNLPGEVIEFQFTKPEGFDGIHKFDIIAIDADQTKLTHTIDIKTTVVGMLKWVFVIRPLHDALIEDLMDKVENEFSAVTKKTEWSLWVVFLRKLLS